MHEGLHDDGASPALRLLVSAGELSRVRKQYSDPASFRPMQYGFLQSQNHIHADNTYSDSRIYARCLLLRGKLTHDR